MALCAPSLPAETLPPRRRAPRRQQPDCHHAGLCRADVFKFCSPTRRSLLSGRYPTHSGTDNGGDATLDLRFTSIATKLKGLGYATHQSGKWHAGHYIMEQTPHGRGFDTSLGECARACLASRGLESRHTSGEGRANVKQGLRLVSFQIGVCRWQCSGDFACSVRVAKRA